MHHNLAQGGRLRRRLGIPNPVAQVAVANAVANHFSLLGQGYSNTTIGQSQPIVPAAGLYTRALVPRASYGELTGTRARIRAGGGFLLKTDISRFYPSIYTHSIPWAMHGKAAAKADHEPSLPGNAIDTAVRNSQDGQTVGIPVGPDTSLAVAETILCEVDKTLATKIPGLRGIRYIDDYELVAQTQTQAEDCLTILESILGVFELAINTRKTSIVKLPQPLEREWVHTLRRFQFRSGEHEQRQDLIAYFDRAQRFAEDHSDDSVLAYALARLNHESIAEANWEVGQSLVMQALHSDTRAFLAAVRVLDSNRALGTSIDLDLFQEVVTKVITESLDRAHHSEAAWGLWAALRYELRLSTSVGQKLGATTDAVVALLALHADERGLVDGGLEKGRLAEYMTEEDLYGSQWLLAYEAGTKGWLSGSAPRNHIDQDPNFARLKQSGVEFYDRDGIQARPMAIGIAPLIAGGFSAAPPPHDDLDLQDF